MCGKVVHVVVEVKVVVTSSSSKLIVVKVVVAAVASSSRLVESSLSWFYLWTLHDTKPPKVPRCFLSCGLCCLASHLIPVASARAVLVRWWEDCVLIVHRQEDRVAAIRYHQVTPHLWHLLSPILLRIYLLQQPLSLVKPLCLMPVLFSPSLLILVPAATSISIGPWLRTVASQRLT